MPPKQKKNFLQHLNFLHGDTSSLATQIAIISFRYPLHPIIEAIIVFFEYVQILSPLLFFSFCFRNDHKESQFSTLLVCIIRIIDPGSWLLFNELDFLEAVLLTIVTVFIFAKFALFGYIVYIAYRRAEGNKILTKLWSHFFQAQGRVIYCVVTSFWINASLKQDFLNNNISLKNKHILIGAVIISSLEFLFSLALNIRFHYVLPSRSRLSAKDNLVEITTLVQKFLLRILTNTMNADIASQLWVFAVLNLLLDFARNGHFFRTLPYYRLNTLFYKGFTLVFVSALHKAFFIMTIVKTADKDSSSLALLMILWGIVSLLSLKLTHGYLEKKLWELIYSPKITCPELLVHRIVAIKELRNMTQAHFEWNEKYAWTFLANASINTNLMKVFRADPEIVTNLVPDIHNEASANALFHSYLDKLLEENPNNKFIQLFAAKFYVRTLRAYRDAVRIAQKLQTGGFSQTSLTASVVLLEIQDIIKQYYMNITPNQGKLNLWTFFNDKLLVAQLKDEMKKQVKLQIKVCQEIRKEAPNLAQIWDDSQEFIGVRKGVLRMAKSTLNSIADSYAEPLLLCAQYQLILNHSFADYVNYLKTHSLKLVKLQKVLNQDHLINENIYDEDVGFFIVSANGSDNGKIVYGSKSLEATFGGDPRLYGGLHIASLAVPCLQHVYADFYRNFSYKTEQLLLNNIKRGFAYKMEGGYMVEIDFALNVYPSITQGFYIVFLVRPIISNKDHMYLLENGDIDCATKEIGKKLGLCHSGAQTTIYNVRSISEELALVHEAFNMVNSPEKYEEDESNVTEQSPAKISLGCRRKSSKFRMTLAYAKELHAVFSTTGKDILLRPAYSSELEVEEIPFYSYNVKVSDVVFGGFSFRLVTLVENTRENKRRITNEFQDSPRHGNVKRSFSAFNIKQESSKNMQSPFLKSPPKNLETSGFFGSEHEKKEGWIDFEAINSSPKRSASTINPLGSMTNRPMLMDSQREPDTGTTARILLVPDEPTEVPTPLIKINNQDVSPLSPQMSTSTNNNVNYTKNLKMKDLLNFKPNGGSLHPSDRSKMSQQQKISNLYKNALDTPYFPRFVKSLYFLFFTIFCTLIFGQSALTINIGYNTNRFQVKKDILRNAQYRNYQMITAECLIRVLWDVNTDSLSLSAFGPLSSIYWIYPYIAQANLINMGTANQNLFVNSSLLNQNIAGIMFTKDVKVFNTYFDEAEQSYESLSTFQATDRLIETGFRVLKALDNTTAEAIENAEFLFRNALNDLIMKNEVISEVLLTSLKDQAQHIRNRITLYWVGLILLFGGLISLYFIVIYRQYRKETENLLAVSRINCVKLEALVKTFENFRDLVNSEDLIQNSMHKARTIAHFQRGMTAKQEKDMRRDNSKTPILTQVRRKYYFHSAKLILLALVIILFIVITAVIGNGLADTLQTRQKQIYFSDRADARISLAIVTSRELISTNNLALVQDRKAEDELELMIQEMEDLKTQAYNLLTDDEEIDENQRAKVEDLLRGDACQYIDQNFVYYCEILTSEAKKSGLVYLLNYLEDYMADKLAKYRSSDKSEASLRVIKEENFYMISIVYILGTLVAEELADTINEGFEEEIQRWDKTRKIQLVVFIFLVIFVCALLWRWVLVRLREGVNEFKNVLRVFPGELILTNYSLKTFLIFTSNGALDSIKNDV